MTNYYERGAVRWKRFTGDGDVRCYRPAKGWSARAEQLDLHPITERELERSQWWIRETYEGIEQ